MGKVIVSYGHVKGIFLGGKGGQGKAEGVSALLGDHLYGRGCVTLSIHVNGGN